MTRDDLTDRLDKLADQFDVTSRHTDRTEFDDEDDRRLGDLIDRAIANPDSDAAGWLDETLTEIRDGSAGG